MNNKHLIITLFVSLMAVSATAEVVYEPLIVDSGFNRDVIAEHTIIGGYAISALYYSGTTSCFATQSVIAYRNASMTDTAIYNRTVRSGWPDNYLDTIRCNTEWGADALNNPPYDDPKLFWMLAPYNGLNALCIRPVQDGDEKRDDDDQLKGFQGEGTLKFKKTGCYERLFFLLVSLRKGSVADRVVTTTIYYTDGSNTSTTFTLTGGLSGEAKHKARMTNIFEGTFNKNTKANYAESAYAGVFHIDVDHTRLIDHIHFSNPIPNSSVSILAITGITADMEIPSEEASVASNINENSFEACWEAIADAASYRLDVATDIDFQHILEDYNNKVISGEQTCQEVADLVANNDYYWRVRSVNSAGGQSASSAPKRVKTQAATGPQVTDETYETIESDMTGLMGSTMNIKVNRTLWKDGYFNTLCLPFSLSAEQIAAHEKLAGCKLYEFAGADVLGEARLDVHVSEATAIEAGKPYLIKWANTGEVINNLVFNGVTITANQGLRVGNENEVQFVGILGKYKMPSNTSNLFVGENNTLYWPIIDDTSLKGFRAYFEIPASGPQYAPKNTPARIVMEQNTATGIESIQPSALSAQKILRDGQLYLMYNGTMYNVQGVRVN